MKGWMYGIVPFPVEFAMLSTGGLQLPPGPVDPLGRPSVRHGGTVGRPCRNGNENAQGRYRQGRYRYINKSITYAV